MNDLPDNAHLSVSRSSWHALRRRSPRACAVDEPLDRSTIAMVESFGPARGQQQNACTQKRSRNRRCQSPFATQKNSKKIKVCGSPLNGIGRSAALAVMESDRPRKPARPTGNDDSTMRVAWIGGKVTVAGVSVRPIANSAFSAQSPDMEWHPNDEPQQDDRGGDLYPDHPAQLSQHDLKPGSPGLRHLISEGFD
jgi:hypothetical protein